MHKKGFAIHWLVLVLAFFASLGAFLYYYSLNPNPIAGDYIGDFQLNLVKNFQRGEKALFYIDKSTNYSAHQVAYDLARQGGFFEPSCEPYYGSNVWIGKDKDGSVDCEPEQEDIEHNFAQSLEKELTEFLAFYPDVLIPAYYDYNVQGSLEITGISKEDIVFDILPEKPVSRLINPMQPRGIYTESLAQNVPEKLKVAMKSKIDIKTIEDEHSEVLVQYAELCRRIGIKEPPGICKSAEQRCCITSGYRHPAYNNEAKGARNSAHQYGLAIDINAITKEEQLRLIRANEGNADLPKLFTRVAIYPDSTHVHFDLMPLKGEYNAPYMILSKKTGTTLVVASSISELEGKAKPFGFG